jgi:Protein of unknown function (DUF2490)
MDWAPDRSGRPQARINPMPNRQVLTLCWLSAGASLVHAADPNTTNQFWPELGIYAQQGPMFRIEFVDSGRSNQSSDNWQGDFAIYVQAALKPVFRHELREQPDVFRNKYLTFRAGYQYRISLTGTTPATENRGIVEVSSRYRLPWQIVISDRNRGDFRFVKGEQFSTRYRNRLWVERDIKYGPLDFTPYVYDEIYYDARYHRWAPNQYAAGVQYPIGRHVVLEPYYLRQNHRPSNPPHLNAFGFKFNLYF